jgi:hypothetical protein
MSRTPYSPFVEKATAPDPWKLARVVRAGVLVGSVEFPGGSPAEATSAPGNSDRFRRDLV